MANLLITVAVAHCTDAPLNCWRVISAAHCKDATTANSLVGVPVVRCKDGATGMFLKPVNCFCGRAQLLPIARLPLLSPRHTSKSEIGDVSGTHLMICIVVKSCVRSHAHNIAICKQHVFIVLGTVLKCLGSSVLKPSGFPYGFNTYESSIYNF